MGRWNYDRIDELVKETSNARINYLVNLPPDALIRIYSNQGREAYDAAEKNGYWSGDADYIHSDDHEWPRPYEWMRRMMAERIPNFSGDYPVWGWTKRPSTKPKEAKFRGTAAQYRVVALVPRKRVLLSDFDNWHTVLNNNYYCDTEAEWDAFHQKWPHHESYGDDAYKAAYQAAVEPTWPAVFEFPFAKNAEHRDWHSAGINFRVQACVDRIYPDEIVSIRHFSKRVDDL